MNAMKKDLNSFLKNNHESNEDLVVLANLAGLDGSVSLEIENKIVLTLINIERESVITKAGYAVKNENNRYFNTNPPLYINLYMLMSALFNNANYGSSLKMLSNAILFFQQKSTFTENNTEGFKDIGQKCTVEIVNIDVQDLNNLWSRFGVRYLPSIIYKIRMLTIDGAIPTHATGAANEMSLQTGNL